MCGAVRFDHPAAHNLVAVLPDVIRVDAGSGPEADAMQGALRLLAAEARVPRPGGAAVVTRLADILVKVGELGSATPPAPTKIRIGSSNGTFVEADVNTWLGGGLPPMSSNFLASNSIPGWPRAWPRKRPPLKCPIVSPSGFATR